MEKNFTRSIGYRYLFTSGRIVTEKSQNILEFESGLEKNFLTLLIFDNAVHTIKTQPHTIKWNKGQQQTRYTPDVLIEYQDPTDKTQRLQTIVFEVKPCKKLRDEWGFFVPRFRIATHWCKERGYLFKLVTEKYIDTPYLNNVNFLLQYDQRRLPTSFLKITSEMENKIFDILHKYPLPVSNVLNQLSEFRSEQQRVLPYLWMLVRHGKLNADLTTPLTMSTVVSNGKPPFDYNFEQSPIRRRLRSRIITP